MPTGPSLGTSGTAVPNRKAPSPATSSKRPLTKAACTPSNFTPRARTDEDHISHDVEVHATPLADVEVVQEEDATR